MSSHSDGLQDSLTGIPVTGYANSFIVTVTVPPVTAARAGADGPSHVES